SYDQLPDIFTEVRSSQFTIVGIEDDTEVEITSTQDSRWLPVRKANEPFVVKLNKGDIYQFQSKTDITGSRIRTVNSCKPFAVFSGTSKTGFCELGNTVTNNPNGQDNLYQQLLPVSVWGRNFVTAPFFNAHQGNFDIYRIQVSSDNTTVTVNGSTTDADGIPLKNPYAKGSVITFHSKRANTISANNPINVTQFEASQSCNTLNNQTPIVPFPGDPEMIILNPIEQTLKDITVYSAISTPQAITNIRSHYINAIIKTADAASFTVDGLTFSANADGAPFATNRFIKINDEYSYIIVDVTQSSESGSPSHRIRADGGFVAIAYGYGSVESYGYLAGSDLRNLNQYIQPEHAITNQPLIGGCIKEPLKLYVILPYKTKSLQWDLGNGLETDPNPDAHYTTETINGILSYKYKYFNDKAVFNDPKIYTIKATAENPSPLNCDAIETVELNLTISGPPTADFTATSEVCDGAEVTFTDKSTGNGLDINKWHWDFGDGTPVEVRRNSDPFTHTYAKSGDYKVTLIVEGITGCQSAISAPQNVHIVELPHAKFSYAFCDNIKFTDESDPIEGAIIKWNWDFGDPDSNENTSEEQHPVHKFSKSGEFTVKLTIQTDKGCVQSFSSTVYSEPTLNAGEDITILIGGEKSLDAIAKGARLKYKWVPSIGLDNDSIPNPIASPMQDTKYTLTVTSNGGCAISDEVFVKVVDPDIPNAFSPNGDGINDKWAIKYLETYVHAKVQIYNRYGQAVFLSDRYVSPWDGTYNGKEIPVGVYYYMIEPNNGRKNMAGSVTIVR
ncbi:MAG: PKD domain-containing protein, partial [Sphingobacteriaceae bacterium]